MQPDPLLATLDRVAALKDEVKQLHPVLRALFAKLPNIAHVDYTHGNAEFGADFILHKFDETLQKTIHIGVIAKSKKILQNHDDVERQIRECFLPRTSIDGKEKIHINEIWVVCSADISKNAQEKIYDSFHRTNITFVPAQRLAELVNKFLPTKLTSVPPLVQSYASDLSARIETENQRALLGITDLDFYVEPELLPVEYDGYGNGRIRQKGSRTLDELITSLSTNHCLMVEAPMGGGKSKFAREMVKRLLAGDAFENGSVFPILLTARAFYDEYNMDVNILSSKFRTKYSINEKSRIVLVVDAFDELDIPDGNRGTILSNLMRGCGNAESGNFSIVLLTRPIDDAGVIAAQLRALNIFRIRRLSGTRAIQLLSRAAGEEIVSERVIADIQQSPLFVALEGTPIAFLLLGRLLAENEEDLPSNLTELFQKYFELALGRWEIYKGLRSQKEYEVINESLLLLSDFLITNNLDETSVDHLVDIVNTYVKPRGVNVDADSLVDKVVNRNSVLFRRNDRGAVGFKHRTFLEFFYAKKLHRSGALDITPKVFDPYWSNSYFFAIGLLRDCPGVIEEISSLPLSYESDRVSRLLNMGQFLLAAYMTPRNVCQSALRRVFAEAAQIYVEALAPDSDLALRKFPTVQLLGVLNALMRQQYGYRHFMDDLAECIYDMEKQPPDSINALALFFLDTAYQSSGGDLRFDCLLKKFGDSLPLPIKLGVKHETDRMKETSSAVLRMERNLRRAFKAHRGGAKAFVARLYDVPIAKLEKPLVTLTNDGGAETTSIE